MTTKVFIALESPNHQPIEITVEQFGTESGWVRQHSREIGAGECHTEYVHSTQRLLISEVQQ